MGTWKSKFSELLNPTILEPGHIILDTEVKQFISLGPNDSGNVMLCAPISEDELWKVLSVAKKGKACGFDSIPMEALNNDNVILFWHSLFNVCFDQGISPSDWGKGIITYLAKSSTIDIRNPLQYRGITLASAVNKLFCSILNQRLTHWAEVNNILSDSQNGFRKGLQCN